ncbi:hypothetical protein SDC9_167932 [bioreactor metagenome]|uniref:Uncharacterized protein n=1 Tax=bioreactor metagenome TaxID=1076179 RepID=A0A645G9G9_9ZZZZ
MPVETRKASMRVGAGAGNRVGRSGRKDATATGSPGFPGKKAASSLVSPDRAATLLSSDRARAGQEGRRCGSVLPVC